MSGSGTNRIADYGDGGFQILFFSLFAVLSELYSQVDMSQWVDIFFEEAFFKFMHLHFHEIFLSNCDAIRKIYHKKTGALKYECTFRKNVTPIVPVL